jgi:hypothetical protein
MERFNLKKLNQVDDKEQFRVEASNMFAAENIKISAKEGLGYFELKGHEPWFEEGCSKLLDQRKQAKLQWLQDPSEINGDDLNNERLEAGRYFKNKKREYLWDKINELATNSKNKNIRDLYRGINEFK